MRNLHLGTIGWSYNFWKDKFYPGKFSSGEFLAITQPNLTRLRLTTHFTVSQPRKPLQNGKARHLATFPSHSSSQALSPTLKCSKTASEKPTFFLKEQNCLAENLALFFCNFHPPSGLTIFLIWQIFSRGFRRTVAM